MRARRAATQPCIVKRRYPHLHLAQNAAAAAAGAQRAALCGGCGGFHLVPPPPLPPVCGAGVRVGGS